MSFRSITSLAVSGLLCLTSAAEHPLNDVAPVLLAAAPVKSKIVLVASHPEASRFKIRIEWQDDGINSPSTSFIPCPEWRKAGTNWTCKVKIAGDTNRVSVAPCGTTNWSNVIVCIP